MAHTKNHDYHIINPSIWPLLGALSALTMLSGAVFLAHHLGRGEETARLAGFPPVALDVHFRIIRRAFHYVLLVVGRGERGEHRRPHPRCAHRVALRCYFIHHIRSHVLCRVVLVVL